MTATISAPLVSADVDLTGFGWMRFHGDRLFASDTWILASPEGKVAALRLWWNGFAHQKPAGSLPDNNRVLAHLAGYGEAVDAFMAIKDEALRGWVRCASDGRLYHPFVAQLALEAWEGRVEEETRRAREREAKKAKREAEKAGVSDGHPADTPGMSDGQKRRVRRTSDDRPPNGENTTGGNPPETSGVDTGREDRVRRTKGDRPPDKGGVSVGIPAENALRGRVRRELEEKGNSNSTIESAAATRARDETAPFDRGAATKAVLERVGAAAETWFDVDRPTHADDRAIVATWIDDAIEAGVPPGEVVQTIGAAVEAQFERLSGRDVGCPRSLRALLDDDVRTAIHAAGRSGASSGGVSLPVPAPFDRRFNAATYRAWLAPCVISPPSAPGGAVRIVAPTALISSMIQGRYELDLLACFPGAGAIEVSISPGAANAVGAGLAVGG